MFESTALLCELRMYLCCLRLTLSARRCFIVALPLQSHAFGKTICRPLKSVTLLAKLTDGFLTSDGVAVRPEWSSMRTYQRTGSTTASPAGAVQYQLTQVYVAQMTYILTACWAGNFGCSCFKSQAKLPVFLLPSDRCHLSSAKISV